MRELIDEYCGGMSPGHELYGYFPGGASGGILPDSLGDIPLDFDTLTPYGCFIGSAAIIVLSQHDSARKTALNAMRFFEDESCGQCTPCRVGTAKAVKLMGTETAGFADVVLPASAFPEKTGTFTNTDRRVQLGRQAIDPPGDARQDLWIIEELARRLGLAWNYAGPAEVFAEIRKAVPSMCSELPT
jgi:NADH dehydrogenase/NADH:ubiquinone oxidoreductase subunit G